MKGDGVIGGRYRVQEPLGRGGMAVVFAAQDQHSGQRLAVKRLAAPADPRVAERVMQLFEREYHTLVQLAHPRIVQVFDYAIDDEGPYYTMELLDGGDLRSDAPLPWRKVCSIARDVCSALSLLHSRRLVHRDLSPANVRCTEEGLGKLIDFGAMVPMGPARHVVGTPPCCAPEVVQRQPLDGRTDLYALGATLYFALTKRHAYHAREFGSLLQLWRTPPPPPSELAGDVPAELDALVMALLQLDPDARPVNAAEVMQRLAAIEGATVGEHLMVAQAYLSTPGMVGRDEPLARVGDALGRAGRGDGGAILVTGPAGVGRSRLLDATALQARIGGLRVLRADAEDALDGEYGVAAALCRQLLRLEPELALDNVLPHAPVLGHLLPELRDRIDGLELQQLQRAEYLRPALQAALRAWLLDAARALPLCLVVDDAHRIDEPSAAVLALLAEQLASQPMLLVASADTDADDSGTAALALLREQAAALQLDPLSRDDTRLLLGSVFGQVPHLDLLTHRLHTLSGGNPRDIMRLAQHLLDGGVLRYEAGAWSLPANIDGADLPASLADALRARLHALSDGARLLARAFALSPAQVMRFEECSLLRGKSDTGLIQRELDELIAQDVIKLSGDGYTLSQHAWGELILERDGTLDVELHRRLAELFERRGDQTFRAAQHLLRAGEHERGLTMLVEHARDSQVATDGDAAAFVRLVASLPPDWYETYGEAVRLCQELGRPPRDQYALQSRLAGMIAVTGTYEVHHVPMLASQLERLSGLTDWAGLDPAMEPGARLMKALELAQARHDQTPERDRVIDPGGAIPQLARLLIQAMGPIASAFDLQLLSRLPSLAPLAPLSPALGVIDTLARGVRARLTGHRDARKLYWEVLDRISQPDGAGLDPSHRHYLQLGVSKGVGLLEASLAQPPSLELAERCEDDPLYRVNGLQLRMLHHLWHGNVRRADELRTEIERLRIQNSARRFLDGTHLTWQLIVHTLSDDFTRTRETLNEIEALSQKHAGWQVVWCFGAGEFHRIRGDHARARAKLEEALSMVAAGEHQIWPSMAGAHVRVLRNSGELEQACTLGMRYLDQAEEAELGDLAHYIRMPLSLALAQHGRGAEAVEQADVVVRELRELGAEGLRLGFAHETRARVALELDQVGEFAEHSRLWDGLLRKVDNPALSSRLARLARDAERRWAATTQSGAGAHDDDVRLGERVAALDGFTTVLERTRCALQQLMAASGANRGVLYALDGADVVRLAQQSPPDASPADIDTFAAGLLMAELEGDDLTLTQVDSTAFTAHMAMGWQRGLSSVILRHPSEAGQAISGIALLWASDAAAFTYPTQLATQLSARLAELGDVSVRTQG